VWEKKLVWTADLYWMSVLWVEISKFGPIVLEPAVRGRVLVVKLWSCDVLVWRWESSYVWSRVQEIHITKLPYIEGGGGRWLVRGCYEKIQADVRISHSDTLLLSCFNLCFHCCVLGPHCWLVIFFHTALVDLKNIVYVLIEQDLTLNLWTKNEDVPNVWCFFPLNLFSWVSPPL